MNILGQIYMFRLRSTPFRHVCLHTCKTLSLRCQKNADLGHHTKHDDVDAHVNQILRQTLGMNILGQIYMFRLRSTPFRHVCLHTCKTLSLRCQQTADLGHHTIHAGVNSQ